MCAGLSSPGSEHCQIRIGCIVYDVDVLRDNFGFFDRVNRCSDALSFSSANTSLFSGGLE